MKIIRVKYTQFIAPKENITLLILFFSAEKNSKYASNYLGSEDTREGGSWSCYVKI